MCPCDKDTYDQRCPCHKDLFGLDARAPSGRRRILASAQQRLRSVASAPIFYDRAKGDRVWDADGNEYIDFVGSWGPMILGHTPDVVLDAVREQLAKGTSFGAPTELEVRMAETLVDIVPSIEMVRMVSSGTEATMSAIRLARGYTC